MESSFNRHLYTQDQSESTQTRQVVEKYNNSAIMQVSTHAQAVDHDATTSNKDAHVQLPLQDRTTTTISMIDPRLTNAGKRKRGYIDQGGRESNVKIEAPTFLETVLGHVPPAPPQEATGQDGSGVYSTSAEGFDVWHERDDRKAIADAAMQVLAQFTSPPSNAQAVSQASKNSNGYGKWKVPRASNKRQKGFVTEASSSQSALSHTHVSVRGSRTLAVTSLHRGLTLPRIPIPVLEGPTIIKLENGLDFEQVDLAFVEQSSIIADENLHADQSAQADFVPPAQTSHEDTVVVRDEARLQSLHLLLTPNQNHYIEAAAQNPIQYMAQGHRPSHWADPFTRLKCFVLDFALSPSLVSKSHAAAPYFLPKVADASRTCYMMEFSHNLGNMSQVAQAYDLTDEIHKIVIKIKTFSESLIDGYTIYSIKCSGEVYYASGNPITIGLEDGTFPNWEAEFGPSWKVEGYADGSMQYMSWNFIIALLTMHAAVAFENNGFDRGEEEVRGLVATTDSKNLNGLDEELWLRVIKIGGFGLTMETIKQMDIVRLSGGLGAAEVAQMYGAA